MPQVGGPGRQARGPTRSQQLANKAQKLQPKAVLGLKFYYRSAEMLLRRAGSYREQNNEDELFVQLMRFVSLVMETIPQHSNYSATDPQFMQLRKKLPGCMDELERVKISLDTKAPHPALLPRPLQKDVVPVSTTMLTEADWSLLRPPSAALSRGSSFQASPSAGPLAEEPGQLVVPSAPASHTGLPELPEISPEMLSFRLSSPSAQALERHTLVGHIGQQANATAVTQTTQQQQQLLGTSLYNISLQQSAPIHMPQQPQASAPSTAPQFADPLVQELASMQISAPTAPLIQQPQLGPQMVDVIDMSPPAGLAGPEPANNCSSCPSNGNEAAVIPSPEAPKAKVGLTDVHVSVALMEDFMRYASSNTRKGIESCGILAGKLNPETNVFTINTLIIPHQARPALLASSTARSSLVLRGQRHCPLSWALLSLLPVL